MRKLFYGFFSLAVLAAGLTQPVRAQSYPDRPIRLIVSIAAGSVTDVILRAAANEIDRKSVV